MWILLATLACTPASDKPQDTGHTGDTAAHTGDSAVDSGHSGDTDTSGGTGHTGDTAIADTSHTGDSGDTAVPDSGDSGPDSGSDSGTDSGGGGDTGVSALAVADFSLPDLNPTSSRYGELVSPRDYLEQTSGWYFTHAT